MSNNRYKKLGKQTLGFLIKSTLFTAVMFYAGLPLIWALPIACTLSFLTKFKFNASYARTSLSMSSILNQTKNFALSITRYVFKTFSNLLKSVFSTISSLAVNPFEQRRKRVIEAKGRALFYLFKNFSTPMNPSGTTPSNLDCVRVLTEDSLNRKIRGPIYLCIFIGVLIRSIIDEKGITNPQEINALASSVIIYFTKNYFPTQILRSIEYDPTTNDGINPIKCQQYIEALQRLNIFARPDSSDININCETDFNYRQFIQGFKELVDLQVPNTTYIIVMKDNMMCIDISRYQSWTSCSLPRINFDTENQKFNHMYNDDTRRFDILPGVNVNPKNQQTNLALNSIKTLQTQATALRTPIAYFQNALTYPQSTIYSVLHGIAKEISLNVDNIKPISVRASTKLPLILGQTAAHTAGTTDTDRDDAAVLHTLIASSRPVI